MMGAAGTGDADAYCAALVRDHDKDRFLANLFAPEARRRHLLALYAFDVEIARVQRRVHEPAAGAIRLQWWHDALAGTRPEEAAGHPVLMALRAALAETGVPIAPLIDAIEARQAELYGEPAIAAASAIYLTAARMLGAEGEVVAAAADLAGAAQTLVGDPPEPDAARQAFGAFRAQVGALPKIALPAFLPLALVPLRLRNPHPPQWRRQLALLRAAYFGFPKI
jgi:phytoene synthase